MENRYAIIIQWSEEDHCFITRVPDLPGCMSDGRTREEAFTNTLQIIHEWILTAKEDGDPIPEPSFAVMSA